MSWEEIHHRARRIAGQIMTEGTKIEESENLQQVSGEESSLLEEFLGTDLLQHEKECRNKFDYQKAFSRIQREKRLKIIRRISAVAACIALMLGSIGIYLGMKFPQSSTEMTGLLASSQQVVLVLSNGKKMVLDGKDTLHLEEGGKALQIQKGQIAYSSQAMEKTDPEIRYNTLWVPRGAEYRIELADGTKVHLNAESELVYPIAFAGDKREVQLRGEAWFEVAKDSLHPFYVKAEGIQVQVYGTAFNVNTHYSQKIQTVLVEGSIGIRADKDGEELRMQPGQLAEYDRKQQQIRLKEVDTRQYTAWREGVFYFNDETLEEILNELSRWYDREVFFRSNQAKELHFSGHLARYEDIRKILDTMTESIGVTFEMNGKTIIVK